MTFDQTPRFEGTTSYEAKFRLPYSPDVATPEAEVRKMAWFGFQQLVEYTAEPPDEFVVDYQRIEEE